MYLEPGRICTDWFSGLLTDYAGVNQGINAQLADLNKVPRDTPIGGVLDPVPGTITIVGETTDSQAALEQLGDTGAVGVVRLYREAELESVVETTVRDLTVPLTIGIAVPKAKAFEAARDCSYYLRAAVRSLRQLQRNENANAGKRERNGIQLLRLMSMQLAPAEGEIGDLQIITALRFDWRVRDKNP